MKRNSVRMIFIVVFGCIVLGYLYMSASGGFADKAAANGFMAVIALLLGVTGILVTLFRLLRRRR